MKLLAVKGIQSRKISNVKDPAEVSKAAVGLEGGGRASSIAGEKDATGSYHLLQRVCFPQTKASVLPIKRSLCAANSGDLVPEALTNSPQSSRLQLPLSPVHRRLV